MYMRLCVYFTPAGLALIAVLLFCTVISTPVCIYSFSFYLCHFGLFPQKLCACVFVLGCSLIHLEHADSDYFILKAV